MTSLGKVLCRRVTFAGALLAVACQNDSTAVFDNEGLNQGAAGSSTLGGSQGLGGDAGPSGGSNASEAGKGGSAKAGTSNGEAGSKPQAGSSGSGNGGSGGSGNTGGSSAGKGGSGGMGGTKPDPVPEPVTVDITTFEDTYVSSCSSGHGSEETLTLDDDTESGCITRTLMRAALDVLPKGALVSKATLALTCLDPGGLINVHYAAQAWSESEVRWNTRPEAGTALGTMICEQPGPVTFDLTAAAVAWLGDMENYGFYLTTETDSGTDFASSEAGDQDDRPVLTVTYTLPLK